MQKSYVAIVIILLILCGCSVQKNIDGIHHSIENEVNTSESDQDKHIENKRVQEEILDNLELKEITKYFDMEMSEILEETTGELSDDFDTIPILESHLFFPYLFDETLGLTFVFNNRVDDSNPIYLIVTCESNVQDINVLGARPGMNFVQIKEVLGETEVTKTWLANEDNIAYQLLFKKDNINYRFISYDENGDNSILYISKQNSR